jgi:hypothetical protein
MCQWILLGGGAVITLWLIIAGTGAIIAHRVESERARRWPGHNPITRLDHAPVE